MSGRRRSASCTGQLVIERDFLKSAWERFGPCARAWCRGITRRRVCACIRAVLPAAGSGSGAQMRRIELYTAHPFYGSRQMNARRLSGVGTRCAGCARWAWKRSIAGRGRAIYPYLLRNLAIERPQQVWCTDITYIPMPRGFLYLVAVMDWFSRAVLSWELSNTLETEFCLQAVNGVPVRSFSVQRQLNDTMALTRRLLARAGGWLRGPRDRGLAGFLQPHSAALGAGGPRRGRRCRVASSTAL